MGTATLENIFLTTIIIETLLNKLITITIKASFNYLSMSDMNLLSYHG